MGDPGPLPFSRCLYFSAETFTTLGYGDVVPHGDLRLLAGIEALNGLLLIGWTGRSPTLRCRGSGMRGSRMRNARNSESRTGPETRTWPN